MKELHGLGTWHGLNGGRTGSRAPFGILENYEDTQCWSKREKGMLEAEGYDGTPGFELNTEKECPRQR